MDIDKGLLLKSFVSETGEGLAQMEEALLGLESHPDDSERVNTVFRVVHTFKGNAGIFELQYAQEFAHTLEDLLDRIRARELSFSPDIADVLLASMDVLREFTEQAAAGKDAATAKSRKLLQRMKEELEAAPAPVVKNESGEGSTPATDAGDQAKPVPAPIVTRTLRVDVEKLDRLLDLTGEIAIARGRTARLLESGERVSLEELAGAHNAEATLQAELQELVMKVRMVPVGPLFRQYQRTVRDLAKELGKTVNLQIEGGEVEVDTSVVEHLRDPLLHMVRNALDHGIERPDERRKAGKPPAGTITLRAWHESGNISIEVADDGAGLDRTKILDAAKKRGIAVDPASLSDHEVYQLVFESGISTTDHVSNFSGRGVGMDVVCRNVQALRGSVSISSCPGVGSTVHLRFPLTLAIIEGFAVEVSGNTYVIPLDQVVECVELPAEQRGSDYGTGVLQLRGEPVPYQQLQDYFQLPGARAPRQNVVVVQQGARRAGLVVDTLHGATQTVIKPLARLFKDVPGVSSSAILGNGRVALILDVPALLRSFELEAAQSV
jgi:two-component system chemotaxis sensor kinase CheA